MNPDLNKEKKKRISEFLKKEGIIRAEDTGQIVIHLNSGGITQIYHNCIILK